jgi:adenine-specific DNA-methyltransferase
LNKTEKFILQKLGKDSLEELEQQDYIGLIRQLNKYGLRFEEQPEEVEEKLKDFYPVLTDYNREAKTINLAGEEKEVKEIKDIVNDEKGKMNYIVEGDNLHGLKAIEKIYEGKINQIYIDPPFNTGNEFKYNDKMVGEDDNYKHSKWLSFMKKRLEIARQLLTEDGSIFVHIDDNEQSQLKLLMDEVFGENNFITTLVIKTSSPNGFKVKANKPVRVKDYILMYCKSKKEYKYSKLFIARDGKWDSHYNKFYDYKQNKTFSLKNKLIEENIMKKNDKLSELDLNNKDFKKYYLKYKNNICQTAFYPNNKHKKKSKNTKDVYKFKNSENNTMYLENGRRLVFLDVSLNNIEKTNELGFSMALSDVWKDIDFNNIQNETPHITFTNGQKPLKLIQRIIKTYPDKNKNMTIMDFFAGSGTTGHAVLDLNKEDGGNRNFILMTNNENTSLNKKYLIWDYLVENDIIEDYDKTKFTTTGKRYQYYKDYINKNFPLNIDKHYNIEIKKEHKENKKLQEFIETNKFKTFLENLKLYIADNGICQNVTYPRMRKVIEGYTDSKGNQVEGLGGNLSYLKTDFVPKYKELDKRELALSNKIYNLIKMSEEAHIEIDVEQDFYKLYKSEVEENKIVAFYNRVLDYNELKTIQSKMEEFKDYKKIIYIRENVNFLNDSRIEELKGQGFEFKEIPRELMYLN